MARRVFPDGGSKLAYQINASSQILSGVGLTALVYSDSGGTTLADIQTYPGGVTIAGSALTVGTDSQLPLFYGPNASEDALYVSVSGGPITAVYARSDDRLDAIEAGMQPLDADLTAIAGLSTAGLVARTGAGTAAARTLTASALPLTVTNGDGVAGNPTVSIANASGTAAGVVTTGAQVFAGVKDFSATPTDSAGSYAGAAPQAVATRNYVRSRMGKVANGSGALSSNTNFPGSTFDPTDKHGGNGSFLYRSTNVVYLTDELMEVNHDEMHVGSFFIKAGDSDGSDYNAANKQYAGFYGYDSGLNAVSPRHWLKVTGSTDTTLTAQLNPGDSTMTVADATGWHNGSTTNSRYFSWWPYTSATGYVWANYTYTRNSSAEYAAYTSPGTWAAGGISGTTVTLAAPWPATAPVLPAGTPVRNSVSAGGYQYAFMTNVSIPNAWTHKIGYVGGVITDGLTDNNKFPPGVQYVRMLYLVNWHGIDDTNVRLSDVSFGPVQLLPKRTPASSAVPGLQGGTFFDDSYLYVQTASGTVKRIALSAF